MSFSAYEPKLTEQFKLWFKRVRGWEANLRDSGVNRDYLAWSAGYDAGYRAPDLANRNKETLSELNEGANL